MRVSVDEHYLQATGTAVAIAHVIGGKDALKKYRRSLEKAHGTAKSAGADPVSELRRRLGAIVPVVDLRKEKEKQT